MYYKHIFQVGLHYALTNNKLHNLILTVANYD
jgi:hypothetical protein